MSDEVTFKENYATLKRISEAMRNQQDPDIDAIIPQVDEATKAYQNCKARLESVKKLLGEKLPEGLPT